MSLLGEPGFGWVIGLVKGCTFFPQASTNHPVLHLVNYDIGFGNDTQSFARNTVHSANRQRIICKCLRWFILAFIRFRGGFGRSCDVKIPSHQRGSLLGEQCFVVRH